ncbi:MAG: murein transglycosylase A [Desulfovermiculus sp.]
MRKIFSRWWSLFLMFALAVFFFPGCGAKEPAEPLDSGLIPLRAEKKEELLAHLDPARQGLNSWEELAQPLRDTLSALKSQEGNRVVLNTPNVRLTVQDLRISLKHMLRILPELQTDPGLLAREFTCYELRPQPLFTGYYEPRLQASLEQAPGYPYPLYALPENLQTIDLGRFHPRWKGQRLVYRMKDGEIAPYHARAEIDGQNALQGKAEVLAWAKDPVDVFFLHIQGSGQLELPDGQRAYIGYAGKNGHEYVSLGRVLVERGHLSFEDLSMQSIKAHLSDQPELMPDILFTNPSYVFFELRNDGPYGALGRKLTPMVSLATDPAVIPLGALLAMQVGLPEMSSKDTLFGLGLAQDVGGAIQGRHVDLYCGSGDQAGYLAGRLKAQGRLCLLVSRTVASQPREEISSK